MIKVVSFDLDGTLADVNFEDLVWRQEIPRLYAQAHGLSLAAAKNFVESEYASVSDRELDWYDIRYWFKRFGLKASHEQVLADVAHVIKLYPDTLPSLKRLSRRFKLVVVSNATREFIDFKVGVDGLGGYFSNIYSMPSDFRTLKTEGDKGFRFVLKELGITAEEMAHVGDLEDNDYEVPRSLGIRAYFLDRSGKRKGAHVVHSLEKFADVLLTDLP